MRGRLPPLFFVGLLALTSLTGCRTAAEISIDVDERGAGQVAVAVELDDAAAQRVGDLTGLVAADDLEQAGWQVSVSDRRVLARKDVQSEGELELALDELGAPFAGLSFDRRQNFARTSLEFSGRVDLTQGMAAFGDEELRRLTGSVIGVDVPPEALDLALQVDLPGEETTNAPGPGARWSVPMGTATAVEAESTDVNLVGLVGTGIAAACGIAIVLMLVIRRLA